MNVGCANVMGLAERQLGDEGVHVRASKHARCHPSPPRAEGGPHGTVGLGCTNCTIRPSELCDRSSTILGGCTDRSSLLCKTGRCGGPCSERVRGAIRFRSFLFGESEVIAPEAARRVL